MYWNLVSRFMGKKQLITVILKTPVWLIGNPVTVHSSICMLLAFPVIIAS